LNNVCIHDKKTWPEAFEFLNKYMSELELFFYEY